MDTTAPPYAGLTAECVLDALDSVGVRGDGRMIALNSYENRVYQLWRDDAPAGRRKVLSALALERRRDPRRACAVGELDAHEIPAVPPMAIDGRTLHRFGDFRFAIFARHGGRAPELEQRATLEHLGRFIARMHTVGAARPFRASSRADDRIVRRRVARIPARARVRSRRYSCRLDEHRRPGAAGAFAAPTRDRAARDDPPARRLPCGQRAVDRRRSALRRLRRCAQRSRRAGPVDAAVRRSRGDGSAAADARRRTNRFATSTGASWR